MAYEPVDSDLESFPILQDELGGPVPDHRWQNVS